MANYGYFIGDVVTKWLKDGRNMKLVQDFQFTDSFGKTWEAKIADIVNGASIPKILWTSVGPPFVGKYRRATVLHDVACVKREEPHKKVHRMFYDAMLADKTSKVKAKEMYLAVATFGPKWDENGNDLKAGIVEDLSFIDDL